MFKKIFTFTFLCISISACNLPVQESNVDATEVDKIVAMTMTAQYRAASEQETSTPIPPSETVTIITETPAPSSTETPESTPTPTDTIIPSGFRDTLGNPSWSNTFDNGSAFGLDATGYEDDYSKIFIENGAMVLSSSSIYGYRGWRLTVKSPDNVYIEAKINVQSCSGKDMYGLVFRAPDYSSGQGYYLGLTCDGNYNVTKWTETGTSTVLSSDSNTTINAGPGKTNLLGIQMVGTNFFIHINNTLINQFSDSSFSQGGHFGLFISGQGAGDFMFRVEDIAYWNLE